MLRIKGEIAKTQYKMQKKLWQYAHRPNIQEKEGNQKELYSLVKRLTNKHRATIYPEAANDQEPVERFSDFFRTKIQKINENFPNFDDMMNGEWIQAISQINTRWS